MLTKQEMANLETTTVDAYSRDRYTSWRACILMLANEGLDYAQAHAVLMSKHMRWAADESNKNGGSNSSDLLRYINKYRAKFFNPKALADLIAGK